MEGDGPTGCMVLREYQLLRDHLKTKLRPQNCFSPLYPMFYAMLARVNTYLSQALSCGIIVMATMLHLSWRLEFFQAAFGSNSPESQRAKHLFQYEFAKRQV